MTTKKKSSGFSAEEKAAMKERAKELKAQKTKEDGKKAVLAQIAKMKGSDKTMAKKIDAIVMNAAPDLVPRTWYGMPAYTKDEKVVCFFKAAGKFNTRYAEFGFNESSKLDQGSMWPTAFALTKLAPAEEKKIAALVKKAVS